MLQTGRPEINNNGKIDADVSIRCTTLALKVVEIMASFVPRTGQILRLDNLEFRRQKNLSQSPKEI